MYRNTRFGELMKGLPRPMLEKAVHASQSDKHSKGFRTWDHLLAMIFAQLSGSRSLREVEAGFNSQPLAHFHLGSRPVKRSTLSDANHRRSSEVFCELCSQLMGQVSRKLRSELKDLLYLMDSTPIPLEGRGYDWTADKHNHRTRGLKVHVVYAATPAVPVRADISYANVNDVEAGRQIPIECGATYVFDKGYTDYNRWFELNARGAVFVTRLKKNAGVRLQEVMEVSENAKAAGVLQDARVQFKHRRPGGGRVNHYHGTALRRVSVSRPDKESDLVLVTNDFDRSAEEIADLYRRRWAIELFFKWLKQNLKIKQFLGQSDNAVRIQIYVALITHLLAYLYHTRCKATRSLKLWIVELRAGLFQRPETEQHLTRKRRRERQKFEQLQGSLAL